MAVRKSDGHPPAPVMRQGRVVGVLSLRDVLAFEADDPGVPTLRPDLVGPLDDEEPLVPPEAPEEESLRWFVELWEEVAADVVTRIAGPEGPEWDALDEHTVEEVMTPRVVSAAPNDPLENAAAVMVREGIHRVLVMEEGRAVGILTTLDVTRAVASGSLMSADATG